jgi:hypothetical protein
MAFSGCIYHQQSADITEELFEILLVKLKNSEEISYNKCEELRYGIQHRNVFEMPKGNITYTCRGKKQAVNLSLKQFMMM